MIQTQTIKPIPLTETLLAHCNVKNGISTGPSQPNPNEHRNRD